jgi:thiol:disulfide interchange protein DsbD
MAERRIVDEIDETSDETEISKKKPSMLTTWVIPLVLFAAGGTFVAWQIMGPKIANAAWINEFDRGLDTSKKTGKPLVVLFTADWCPACQELKKDALSRTDVSDALKADFTPVKVDLTDQHSENGRIAQTFGVSGIPTIIMFDTKGQQVDRVSGVVPGDNLLQWLQNKKAQATAK